MREQTRRGVLIALAGSSGCLRSSRVDSTTTATVTCGAGELSGSYRSHQFDAQNSGRVPYSGPRPSALSWSVDAGNNEGGIVSDGEAFYTGNGNAVSYSRDGEERWSVDVASSIDETPALTCNLVLFPSLDSVIGIGRNTGKKHWKQRLGNITSPIHANGGSYTVCASDTVYSGSVSDGSIQWEFAGDGLTKRGLCGTSETMFAVAGDSASGAVHALDSKSGKAKWTVSLPSEPLSPPATKDGRIYVPLSNGELRCLSARNGSTKWSGTGLSDRTPIPAIGESKIYVSPGNGEELLAYDIADGKRVWHHRTGPVLSPPIVTGAGILVGTMNRGLKSLSPTGEIQWEMPEEDIRSPLCLSNQFLVFKTAKNPKLKAFEL